LTEFLCRIQGPDAELGEFEKVGLIPRVVHGLFDGVDRADPSLEFSIKVSYVEIYMETIRDLLEPSSINLQLREDKERGIFIDKARSIYVSSPEEMMEVIAAGAENRELSATGMNAGSSRSHSVLIVSISSRNTDNQSTKAGKLFLVDLAGSEMVSKTGAEGQQLEEAKMINKSLTSLGKVIKSLTESKGAHIPYRDSKLTRMLQESLGGNSRTVLIICVSMSMYELRLCSCIAALWSHGACCL
jgi:kinesin family member 5